MIRVQLIVQLMILVHSVDLRPVGINAEQIVAMAAPGEQYTPKSNCLITFSNGKFINTSETCDVVGEIWRIEDAKVK